MTTQKRLSPERSLKFLIPAYLIKKWKFVSIPFFFGTSSSYSPSGSEPSLKTYRAGFLEDLRGEINKTCLTILTLQEYTNLKKSRWWPLQRGGVLLKLLKLAQVLPLWSTACGDDLYHWLWWWFNQMFLYVIIIIWNSTADRESRNSRYASTQSNIHANKSKHALKGAQEQGHRRPWPPWPACDSRPVVRFCFLDSGFNPKLQIM